ncbi:unnamed protein product [marine sediment metagenome]|uniref:Uncharacterized protein n=1 Tax=marine sediment metagenome TaxID=412755 RepID=X1IS63_9ZZZZ
MDSKKGGSHCSTTQKGTCDEKREEIFVFPKQRGESEEILPEAGFFVLYRIDRFPYQDKRYVGDRSSKKGK